MSTSHINPIQFRFWKSVDSARNLNHILNHYMLFCSSVHELSYIELNVFLLQNSSHCAKSKYLYPFHCSIYYILATSAIYIVYTKPPINLMKCRRYNITTDMAHPLWCYPKLSKCTNNMWLHNFWRNFFSEKGGISVLFSVIIQPPMSI